MGHIENAERAENGGNGGKSYKLIIIASYYNIRCSINIFDFYKQLRWLFYAYYTVIIILFAIEPNVAAADRH
jgi:hypothetical protein